MADGKALEAAVDAVVRDHPAVLEQWMTDTPGSWGFLAGQAVLAYKRHLGRPLTSLERRVVWQALWDRLQALKMQSNWPRPEGS